MKDKEELDNFGGRKHRSSRSHKHSSQLDLEELDNRKRKSNADHDKIRKRSSIAESDNDVDSYLKREPRSKILRKIIDERNERRTSEYHHGSLIKSSSDTSYDRDVKKARENERRYSDRKEGGEVKDIKKSYDIQTGRGVMGSLFIPIQPVGPNMNFPMAPPSVFMPQFPGILGWPGPPNVHPLLSVSGDPRFMPNIGDLPNHPMCFNQQGLIFYPAGHISMPDELQPGNWNQTRNSLLFGTAPSSGDQNDYSQNFVDTGRRPQNFIRELDVNSVVEDYPKIRELIQRKDEIVKNAATPPMYYKCDLKEHILSLEFFGTKFDVILVDPPWEEYAQRATGVTDHLDYWTSRYNKPQD